MHVLPIEGETCSFCAEIVGLDLSHELSPREVNELRQMANQFPV